MTVATAEDLTIPTWDDVLAAHERVRPYIHRTPILTSRFINELAGAELFFKCENLQKAGAFKVRGASQRRLRPLRREGDEGRRHPLLAATTPSRSPTPPAAAASPATW